MDRPTFSRALSLCASAVLGAGLVASCSSGAPGASDESTTSEFSYQVPVNLSTTNAGTDVGASEFAQMLSARLYPGVFVVGPSGQMIPNTDLVRTQALPGAQRIVEYTLSDEAVFSDGEPVTCTDYLLAFTAGKNPALFGSHMPLFEEVERLDCEPGAKTFDVVFAPGHGAQWRELFGPGTVVPAHAVAAKLGTDVAGLSAQLDEGDAATLRPVAEVWRSGFDLANFDPAMHVSFGPYTVDSVGEAGQVSLVANERYYGDAPLTDEIVVWPGTAASAQLNGTGNLRVADLAEPNPEWLDINAEGNELDVTSLVGTLTESLTFETAGPWSFPANRQALARCADPNAVAAASSGAAGVEVPSVLTHVVPNNDPLAPRFDDIVAPRGGVDIAAASAAGGLELRVGYAHVSPRMASMVDSIRATCEPAGISVIDVTAATGAGATLRDLGRVDVGEWGEDVVVEGTIDAMLRPVNPQTEYTIPSTRAADLDAMRKRETELWDELPSLPLAAQPRSFAVDRKLSNVIVYTGPTGIGWNMDRWQLRPASVGDAAPQAT